MRLLYVTHHRRTRTVARPEAWARELARRGYAVTLMCLGDTERWRTRESERDGIHWVETPDLLWGRMRSGWDPMSAIRRVQWLRGRHYDLVHCFETRPATIFPVLHYIRRHPTPVVIDWNDWWGRGGLIKDLRPIWYQVLFGRVETFFEEHYRSRAVATTVISRALADRAVSLGVPRETIFRIQGGVDPSYFRVLPTTAYRERYGLPKNAFILGFAAADATMDMEYVLDEVALASAGDPEMLLLITGRKPPRFDQMLDRRGMRDRVRHLGFVPYADLPVSLSCADVFLLPFLNRISNVGRWPHKVGEYMSLGRPVVTNAVGDLAELFAKGEFGMLAGTARGEFANAIRFLKATASARQQMGRNARSWAEREFAWPRIVDRVEQCYRFVGERTGTERK